MKHSIKMFITRCILNSLNRINVISLGIAVFLFYVILKMYLVCCVSTSSATQSSYILKEKFKLVITQRNYHDICGLDFRVETLPTLYNQAKYNGSVSESQCRLWGSKDAHDNTLIQNLFYYDPGVCADQQHVIFCTIHVSPTKRYQANCTISQCKGNLSLGVTDSKTGNTDWAKYSDKEKLQQALYKILNLKDNVDFCWLKCDDTENRERTQLLVFPHAVKVKKKSINPLFPSLAQKSRKDYININIIWLDSVSRFHFYRSLPQTVKLFNRINSDVKNRAKVLDFQIFQAVKSRTYESLQALFTGVVDIDEVPFGRYSMPYRPLDIQHLLKQPFYSTLWLEDQCWSYEWGLPKDLLTHNASLSFEERWKRYHAGLTNAGIDDVGITITSCDIISMNGVDSVFHGPDTLCVNGRHSHEYFFNYLTDYQTQMSSTNQPFFTMYANNIAHDETGRRIQTLDSHLVDYVKFASQLHNTLTLIVSDHGNTYGKYHSQSAFARMEVFNPTFFMAVPANIQTKLGASVMHSLITNQKRYITLVDVHKALVSVMNYPENFSPQGLFVKLDARRNCSDVRMHTDVKCICVT